MKNRFSFFFSLATPKRIFCIYFCLKNVFLKIVSEVLHARSKKTRYTLEVISYLVV